MFRFSLMLAVVAALCLTLSVNGLAVRAAGPIAIRADTVKADETLGHLAAGGFAVSKFTAQVIFNRVNPSTGKIDNLLRITQGYSGAVTAEIKPDDFVFTVEDDLPVAIITLDTFINKDTARPVKVVCKVQMRNAAKHVGTVSWEATDSAGKVILTSNGYLAGNWLADIAPPTK